MQLILFFAVILLLALGVYVEWSVWHECRAAGHSWLYCWAMLRH